VRARGSQAAIRSAPRRARRHRVLAASRGWSGSGSSGCRSPLIRGHRGWPPSLQERPSARLPRAPSRWASSVLPSGLVSARPRPGSECIERRASPAIIPQSLSITEPWHSPNAGPLSQRHGSW
jgi:hypothetical protein